MSPELHELIEAVRALGISLTGEPAPRCIKVADVKNIHERMERVQRALESVDAAAGTGQAAGAPAPRDDPKKLKQALDKLIRLHQIKGGSLDDVDAVLRETFGLDDEAAKRKKEHGVLPAFAPARLKKKKGYRPRLNLMPDRPGQASLSDLRRIVFEVEAATALLGSTVPDGERPMARARRRMFPPPPRA